MEYYRTDKADLKVIETGEGFLKAKITIARAGVFQYFNNDGSVIHEAKLPEDIFSTKTIATANGVPITDFHPKYNDEPILVDSKNYSQYVRGTISDPKVEKNEITNEPELNAFVTVYDSDLIKKIKNKQQNQASIGFVHTVDAKPGSYKGVSYDLAQKNIMINHVALVPEGRAGESVKIHIDKKGKTTMSKKWIIEGDENIKTLTYRKYDGSTDIQVDPDIHQELMSVRNDAKDISKKFDVLEKENTELKEKIEKVKADANNDPEKEDLVNQLEIANDKADEWRKKHDALEASIPELVEQNTSDRVELVEFAKSVDTDMKVDGLTNREIKLQVIAKGLPFKSGIKVDSMSDEIVEARFDAACELLREKATHNDNNGRTSFKIDRNTIEEKKAALQNVYQRNQEKIQSGGTK